MSFDTQTRNRLASFVGKCRTLLCGDFKSPGGEMARQLAHYGIQDTGKFFEVDSLTHLDEPGRETARTLRSILAHKQATAPAAKVWKKFDAAVYDLIQEQGFTVLNRLCALRMAEERKILQFPCISKGLQSDGFELYEYHTGKANAAISKEDRFQHFVFSLFDELSLDLGSLFDRFSPQGLLFPAPQALGELLALINDPALAHLWAEDETIGWIYQYWNSKEERKAMRDASAAPRNSRELAVRNQFFTPRYVVQFLTDNTLGRIWYEMCQGKTGLVNQCEYLVHRPNEVFLAEGASATEVPSDQSAVIGEEVLTQEELLKQPVYIPFRPLKDPREIRLLDPACGSMHFGLYAFDLFEKIYSEFWDLAIATGGATSSTDHRSLITDHSLQPLTDLYASKEAYMLDVPKMIIEHNIHGIDIDPRAAQIAGLALWLRAQRSWQSAGLLATQRPKVERSNIVCAEPMPGDKEQLEEFTARLHPAIGLMVAAIFEKMQLAGEAGSLLKIEAEITTLVDDAKAAWKQIGKSKDEMFSAAEIAKGDRRAGTQTQLDIGSWNLETLSAISDSDFFEQAEHTIYKALARYAESAAQGSYKRKLFAHDAAQGFAFIDLCRKRYDAVVMNPPFGLGTSSTRESIETQFPLAKNDLSISSVDRGLSVLAQHGRVGAITTRTVFFNSTFAPWRSAALESQSFVAVCDLGFGVLDAMVETVMYIIENSTPVDSTQIAFSSLLASKDKEKLLKSRFQSSRHDLIFRNQRSFSCIPSSPLAYWLTPGLLSYFGSTDSFLSLGGTVAVGIQTGDNPRFLRLRWEAPFPSVSAKWHETGWMPMGKGGEYSPWWDDVHLTVRWSNQGAEIKSHPSSCVRNSKWFFESGGTYPYRTTSAFTLRCFPEGCLFSDGGWGVFPPSNVSREEILAVFNSRIARYFMEVLLGQGDSSVAGSAARNYTNEAVGSIPWISQPLANSARKLVAPLVNTWRSRESDDESTCFFISPIASGAVRGSIKELATVIWENYCDRMIRIGTSTHAVETAVFTAYGLPDSDKSIIDEEEGCHPYDYSNRDCDADEVRRLFALDIDKVATEVQDRYGSKRFVVKKSFSIDRKIDLVAHLLRTNPEPIIRSVRTLPPSTLDFYTEIPVSLLSYGIGLSFGRWDISYATGERQAPELPDPFDPLPVCPPGMLQNESGLPLSIAELSELNAEGNYPLRISIDGILVDDAGHAGEDIVARVRGALAVIWGERSGAIEQEACDILKVKELRDYFSEGKSGGKFFKDHLKRYSKSRRKAPIYWPLSTESGGYTLWLYYHRLSEDSLYTAVTQFILPRQEEATATFARLGAKQERSKAEDKELESAQTLVAELATLKDSLLEIAKFWKPNLNDGVQITAAPLWKHFRLGAWQTVLRDTWNKLQKGEYDWAHLAHSTWPERVIPKCTTDRSLAIAHGHEQSLWEEVENSKGKLVWQPKKDAKEIAEELVRQHRK